METNYSLVVMYLNQAKKNKTNPKEKIGVLASNGNSLPYPFQNRMAITYKENSIEGKVTISLPFLSSKRSEGIQLVQIHNLPEKYIQKMNSK